MNHADLLKEIARLKAQPRIGAKVRYGEIVATVTSANGVFVRIAWEGKDMLVRWEQCEVIE